MPHLGLVYYRTPTPEIRLALEEPLLAHLPYGDFSCGGHIQYGKRLATLGVALDLGGRKGILTVDHLFSSQDTQTLPSLTLDSEPTLSDESNSPLSSGLNQRGSNSLWEDDDEYDDLDKNDSAPSDQRKLGPEATLLNKHSSQGTEALLSTGTFEEWNVLASSAQLAPSAAYLDWALAWPEPTAQNLFLSHLNTVFPEGPGSEGVILKKIQESPTAHLAPVYIVSGIRGILRGQILSLPSFLSSVPGEESCEAWTVILDASHGPVISGECGSVVVDKATNKVYGHVVGSDPLGHAYVVSLAHVLAQVTSCFKSEGVPRFAVPDGVLETVAEHSRSTGALHGPAWNPGSSQNGESFQTMSTMGSTDIFFPETESTGHETPDTPIPPQGLEKLQVTDTVAVSDSAIEPVLTATGVSHRDAAYGATGSPWGMSMEPTVREPTLNHQHLTPQESRTNESHSKESHPHERSPREIASPIKTAPLDPPQDEEAIEPSLAYEPYRFSSHASYAAGEPSPMATAGSDPYSTYEEIGHSWDDAYKLDSDSGPLEPWAPPSSRKISKGKSSKEKSPKGKSSSGKSSPGKPFSTIPYPAGESSMTDRRADSDPYSTYGADYLQSYSAGQSSMTTTADSNPYFPHGAENLQTYSAGEFSSTAMPTLPSNIGYYGAAPYPLTLADCVPHSRPLVLRSDEEPSSLTTAEGDPDAAYGADNFQSYSAGESSTMATADSDPYTAYGADYFQSYTARESSTMTTGDSDPYSAYRVDDLESDFRPGSPMVGPPADSCSYSTPYEGDSGRATPRPSGSVDLGRSGDDLDGFDVHHSSLFQPGRIFKVIWTEPSRIGGSGSEVPTLRLPSEHGGQAVYHTLRRFIIVANDEGYCTCVPILTYGLQGCKKNGVKPLKHGIIYQEGKKPRRLRGEPKLGFEPAQATLYGRGEQIAKEARVNYAKLQTVEHNSRVSFIGRVVPEDFDNIVKPAVDLCWENKMRSNN